MLPSRRRGCKSWHCSRTASASAPHTPQQLPGGNGKCGKSIPSLISANYLLVLLLQLPQCLLLHLLARIWPESYHDAIMARVKFIISRKSTCKHRRACCRASWWTSPSCWSRPSRPGLPSSCCFSPCREMLYIGHRFKYRTTFMTIKNCKN